MQDNYRRLLQSLTDCEPAPGLIKNILMDVARREARRVRARFALLLGSTGVSLTIAVMMFAYTAQEFAQSGFYQYISLAFSDGGAVFASWQEFMLLLAEAAPLSGVIVGLLAILVSLGTIKSAFKNVGGAYAHA